MKAAFGVLFLIGALPTAPGIAQRPPESEDWSAGFSASIVAPADRRTETSLGGSVDVEAFLSKSISVGVLAGFWAGNSDFAKNSEESYFALIGTYRLSDGKLRPLLQFGGGVYRLQFQFQSRNRFAPQERETRGGAFGGVGLDYKLSRTSTLRGGARYHLVSDASGVHPDFLEGHLGVMFSF